MRRIKLLLFIFLVSSSSYAQSPLVFTNHSYLIPQIDSLNSITIIDTIYDSTLNSYNIDVSFGARVNSRVCDSFQFMSSPAITTADTIQPHVPIPLTFTIHDSVPPSGGFIVGPNVIVIWPIYHSGINPVGPVDSVYIYTTYTPLGIEDAPLSKMFIFQTSEQLNIHFGEAENMVQQVRIYNILGQSIYAGAPDRSKSISTAGWTTGIYLCEVNTVNGAKRTFKFKLE